MTRLTCLTCCKGWANSSLAVVGRLISIKPNFPLAAKEEGDPGSEQQRWIVSGVGADESRWWRLCSLECHMPELTGTSST